MNFPLQQFLQNSSLGKRQNPNMEALCQEELSKKLKTAFSPMPFQQNYMPYNPHMMQNLQFLLGGNQGFSQFPLMPKGIHKPVISIPQAKEEYVKQEESPLMVKSETTTAEISQGNSPMNVAEPILFEYTRAFPDWDIGTIFSFLESGQSKESFLKEKEFRAERKKRRAAKKREIAAKKTAQVSNKAKINVKLE